MAKRSPLTELERLQKVWYAKLKKEGFNDIEDARNPDLNLTNHDAFSQSNKYGQHTPLWRQSKEEYYQMATYFLNHYKFASNLEKIIWEYHTNAMSRQDIAATLKKMRLLKTGEFGVGAIIRKLKKIMFIGAYEEHE